MEITRPSLESPIAAHAWVERRRVEFHNTSTAVRVLGAVGWALVALSLVTR